MQIQRIQFTVLSFHRVFGQSCQYLREEKNDKVPYHLRKSGDYHTNLHTKNDKVAYHGHSRLRH